MPAIASTLASLPPDEAHLYLLAWEGTPREALLRPILSWLTAEERRRHDRYVFEKGRAEYLLTRALVRAVLSRYAHVAPEDWRFEENERGRPSIVAGAAPADAPSLRFNLSNTDGMIACLVGGKRDVGVDVEDTGRRLTDDLAERSFAPSEIAALRALPDERQHARFFEYWTLKESYIKARGLGLAIPLDEFAFHLDGGRIAITIDPRLGDDAPRWQFALLQPTSRHTLAIAIDRGDHPDITLRTIHLHFDPLRELRLEDLL